MQRKEESINLDMVNVDNKFLLFLCFVLFSGQTLIDASDSESVQQQLKFQAEEISLLRNQLKRLEYKLQKQTQHQELGSLKEEVEEIQEDLESQREELEGLESNQDYSIKFNGYLDFKAVDYKSKENLHKDSFDQHHTALFFNANRGRAKVFAELEWEHSGKQLKQERAWLSYSLPKKFSARVGHFFAPTYWNLNHYPTIADSINDPDFTRRFFPRSLTGVQLSKEWIRGDSSLSFNSYYGNGFEDDPTLPGRDRNASKALGQKLRFQRTRQSYSYGVNLHYYTDHRQMDLLGRNVAGEGDFTSRMLEGDLKFGQLGLLGAVVDAEIRDGTFPQSRIKSESWYIQPSWSFTSRLKTYLRYGDLDLDDSFVSPVDRKEKMLGLNFKPDTSTTLKVEWLERDYANLNIGSDRELWSSVSLAF